MENIDGTPVKDSVSTASNDGAEQGARTEREVSADTDSILSGAAMAIASDDGSGGGVFKRILNRGIGQGQEKIDDLGAIDDYKLPRGFRLVDSADVGAFDYREYKVPTNPTMKISYWNWNKPSSPAMDPEASKSLQDVLGGKPHKLTPGEISSLSQIFPAGIYGPDSNYKIADMRTERMDGQNVLVLENQWLQSDRQSYGIFFPSDRSASHIGHLHFEGSKADFKVHWPRVKRSLSKINLDN